MKRRDITLGEMQDECKKYCNGGNLGYCGKCKYMEACCHYESYTPAQLNLTDSPRFNEAQMAFWRGWYAMGARKAVCASGLSAVNLFDGKNAFALSGFTTSGFDSGLKNGEILDLAELIGKDGAE